MLELLILTAELTNLLAQAIVFALLLLKIDVHLLAEFFCSDTRDATVSSGGGPELVLQTLRHLKPEAEGSNLKVQTVPEGAAARTRYCSGVPARENT